MIAGGCHPTQRVGKGSVSRVTTGWLRLDCGVWHKTLIILLLFLLVVLVVRRGGDVAMAVPAFQN